jgi:hypothetical protein
MSCATLRPRVQALERFLGNNDPNRCDGPTTVIVGPDEPIPPGPGGCPLCGRDHVLVITEEVVDPPEPEASLPA